MSVQRHSQRFSWMSSDQPAMIEPLEPRTLLAALPVVSVAATTPAASENGDAGQFTISLDAPAAAATKINFRLTGTATNGTDYSRLPGSVTIPAGESSAIVNVVPIDDGRIEPQETVVLTLASYSLYRINLALPGATVTIDDATYLAADFFPLTDGARWDYNGVANRTPFHLTATGSTLGPVYHWALNPSIDDDYALGAVMEATGDGIVMNSTDGIPDPYNPPLLWMPASMTIGSTFASSSTRGTATFSEIGKVVGVETVRVPAGTFRALKVQGTMDMSDQGWTGHVVSTAWFVRGVGLVKRIQTGTENAGGVHSTVARSWNMTSWCLSSPWQARADMNTARDQFTGGVINGKIYVFGGNGNPDGLNLKSTEVYDPNLNTWTPLADNENNSGEGVEELTSAVVNGKLYVFGAWGGTGPGGFYGNFNFSQEYDPDTDTWTNKAPKPTPVSSAPCAVYNGEIFVFGGEFSYEDARGKYHQKRYNVVEAYNPGTDTWRLVTKMPKTVINPALAVVGDRAYLLGGVSSSIKPVLTPMAFDFATGAWIKKGLAPMPRLRTASYSSATPVVDGKIYLVGGAGGGSMRFSWATNVVDIYDTATNTWSTGPSLPVPVDNHLSVVVGDSLYVVGGYTFEDLADCSLATVWQLPLT